MITSLRAPLVAGALLLSLAACGDDPEPEAGAIGVPRAKAGCQDLVTKDFVTPASGSHHVAEGTDLDYPSPPAAELHHDTFPFDNALKNIYSVEDRPRVPDLVHLAEHGYNILWYDETIADDADAMGDIEAVADQYPKGEHLVIAPWTSQDGDAFPGGAHVALTHWTGPTDMQGITQFCEAVSGEVVDGFTADYVKSNSPEPDAP